MNVRSATTYPRFAPLPRPLPKVYVARPRAAVVTEAETPRQPVEEELPMHLWWDQSRSRYIIWKAFAKSRSAKIMSAAMVIRLVGIGTWGYMGVFLAEATDSATFFIPTPGHVYTFAVAGALNPLVVACCGALGSTLGEVVGYALGSSGRNAVQKGRMYLFCESLSRHWGGKVLLMFALVPGPLYLCGLWAGMFRYSFKRFFMYALAGKMVMILGIALAGYLLAS
ncbi:MAG: VTT domain-containing protein [Chloroflexi bacterium]|nr:VTT domain-containing protein [Chloroflexota bacterium]